MEDVQIRKFFMRIYYLVERDIKSAWYRVKNSDEIWIYPKSDPLNLWLLDKDNNLTRNKILYSNNPIELILSDIG